MGSREWHMTPLTWCLVAHPRVRRSRTSRLNRCAHTRMRTYTPAPPPPHEIPVHRIHEGRCLLGRGACCPAEEQQAYLSCNQTQWPDNAGHRTCLDGMLTPAIMQSSCKSCHPAAPGCNSSTSHDDQTQPPDAAGRISSTTHLQELPSSCSWMQLVHHQLKAMPTAVSRRSMLATKGPACVLGWWINNKYDDCC